MTWQSFYEALKFWLPVVTVVGLIIRGYLSAKKAASAWANTMLDNHMAHIQDASEKASTAVIELAGYHKEMLDQQREMVTNLTLMQRDFHEQTEEDSRVQSDILTGIEVIKSQTA